MTLPPIYPTLGEQANALANTTPASGPLSPTFAQAAIGGLLAVGAGLLANSDAVRNATGQPPREGRIRVFRVAPTSHAGYCGTVEMIGEYSRIGEYSDNDFREAVARQISEQFGGGVFRTAFTQDGLIVEAHDIAVAGEPRTRGSDPLAPACLNCARRVNNCECGDARILAVDHVVKEEVVFVDRAAIAFDDAFTNFDKGSETAKIEVLRVLARVARRRGLAAVADELETAFAHGLTSAKSNP